MLGIALALTCLVLFVLGAWFFIRYDYEMSDFEGHHDDR